MRRPAMVLVACSMIGAVLGSLPAHAGNVAKGTVLFPQTVYGQVKKSPEQAAFVAAGCATHIANGDETAVISLKGLGGATLRLTVSGATANPTDPTNPRPTVVMEVWRFPLCDVTSTPTRVGEAKNGSPLTFTASGAYLVLANDNGAAMRLGANYSLDT